MEMFPLEYRPLRIELAANLTREASEPLTGVK
jgi:hypothetical protein